MTPGMLYSYIALCRMAEGSGHDDAINIVIQHDAYFNAQYVVYSSAGCRQEDYNLRA